MALPTADKTDAIPERDNKAGRPIRVEAEWNTNLLLCPGCGNPEIHQFHTEIFARHEDAPQGMHIAVSQPSEFQGDFTLRHGTDLSGNPSLRRQGMLIWFFCEHCHGPHGLSFAQHKGSTQVRWLDDHQCVEMRNSALFKQVSEN